MHQNKKWDEQTRGDDIDDGHKYLLRRRKMENNLRIKDNHNKNYINWKKIFLVMNIKPHNNIKLINQFYKLYYINDILDL